MLLVAQDLQDAHELIGSPTQLERELRLVANDQGADRLQKAIAICALSVVASAPMTDPDPVAYSRGVGELKWAYSRIEYIRSEAATAMREITTALEELERYKYAVVEPLWPDDAEKVAAYFRQRGYGVEIRDSAWDVHDLDSIVIKKRESK